MLEKQAVWKREGGFDRIEIIAEMHKQTLRRLHAGFDSKPLYTGLQSSMVAQFRRTYAGNERQGREIQAGNSTFEPTTAAAI